MIRRKGLDWEKFKEQSDAQITKDLAIDIFDEAREAYFPEGTVADVSAGSSLTLQDIYDAKEQLDSNEKWPISEVTFEDWTKRCKIMEQLEAQYPLYEIHPVDPDWTIRPIENTGWWSPPTDAWFKLANEEETKLCTCDIRMLAHFQGCQCGGK